MKMYAFRFITIIVAINIILFKLGTDLLIYMLVLHLGLEVLNNFRNISKLANSLILSYGIFIVIYRSWDHTLPIVWIQIFNRFEHLSFTAVLVWIVFKVINIKRLRHRVILSFLVVNVIGIANEVFQMAYRYRDLRINLISRDTIIDIIINCLASILFLLLIIWNKKKQTKLS